MQISLLLDIFSGEGLLSHILDECSVTCVLSILSSMLTVDKRTNIMCSLIQDEFYPNCKVKEQNGKQVHTYNLIKEQCKEGQRTRDQNRTAVCICTCESKQTPPKFKNDYNLSTAEDQLLYHCSHLQCQIAGKGKNSRFRIAAEGRHCCHGGARPCITACHLAGLSQPTRGTASSPVCRT